MKKCLSILFICLAGATVFAQEIRKPQLSPLTRHYLHQLKKAGNNAIPEGYAFRSGAGGEIFLTGMIKVSAPALAEESLKKMGAKTGTRAGDIWTVQVPSGKIHDFTNAEGIAYIQLDEPAFPHLDAARKTTRVDSVHKGYGLPLPYSGAGVIMGVIDFGFDYNHPSFYDTTGMAYRIRKVWEQGTQGTPPAGYSYGHEIADSNALRIKGTDNEVQTHGTAVAGMGAGSGVGSTPAADRFRGMAYDADMVFVGVRREAIASQWIQGSFSDFVDGLAYIFNYADAAGKPAVVNISWGSESGPHDGTTLFNQACDNLSGPGKIIVMSAGNDGQEKLHISKTFTPSDTMISTFITFTPATYKRTWADVWGEQGKTFCVKATLYSNGIAGNTTDFVCIDDNIHDLFVLGANGLDTCFVEFITSSAELINGKPRMTLNVFNKAADSLAISIKGTDGTIHAWNEYYYYGYTHHYQSEFRSLGQSWAVTGDSNSTASDMGAAQSVLLVGAYASKVNYSDINNNPWTYSSYVTAGRIVPFSSRGPMIDGRIKPDITAPGLTIATAISSHDTSYTATGSNSSSTVKSYTHPVSGKTFHYAEFTGTSAAAPAASGIIALLLQANPALTPQQVKDIIAETAIKDSYTGALPASGNNTWGHGKINAYGAIKKVVQQLGVYSFSGRKPDCVVFPNPNGGSFTLDYTADQAETITIRLYGLTGRLLYDERKQVNKGANLLPVSYPDLAPGMYVLNVSAETGMVSIKLKIQ